MVQVLRTCARIAASEATVLLTGETGTGKEVVARHIHERSPRAKKPLVPVNCGAIPETLLESELFGHARGAFTGASAARRGRVALADGGTLFLDEIGELPLSLQVKLLRLLQERTFEPLGSAESVSVSFRLIAATNRDLAAEVEAGRFRRDLYYRLMVCPIQLPALRERICDVSRLFQHFWSARGETRVVDNLVHKALGTHSWPGNVRELENLVERISVCAEGTSIGVNDLPPEFCRSAGLPEPEAVELCPAYVLEPVHPAPVPSPVSTVSSPVSSPVPPAFAAATPTASAIAPPAQAPTPAAPPTATEALAASLPLLPFQLQQLPIDLPALLRQSEDAYISAALAQAKGNKKEAADLLGLQRTTLVEKLRRRNRDARQAPDSPER